MRKLGQIGMASSVALLLAASSGLIAAREPRLPRVAVPKVET